MARKKSAYVHPRHKNDVNKKAIIWIASVLIFIIVVIAVLLVIDNLR